MCLQQTTNFNLSHNADVAKIAKVPWYYWRMVHPAKLNKVLKLRILSLSKEVKTLQSYWWRESQTRVWPVQRVHAQQYIHDYLEIRLHMFFAFSLPKNKSTNEQRQNDKYHLHTHHSQSRPRPFCSYNQYSLSISLVLNHFTRFRRLSLSLSLFVLNHLRKVPELSFLLLFFVTY